MKSKEKAPAHGRPGAAQHEVFLPDVTVAAVVMREGRLLVVEERVRGALVINQPAGHLEPDEALVDAMARETLEETGWHVEATDFIGVYQWKSPDDGRHFMRVAYAARALAHDPLQPLDDGIVRALWLSPEEMRACAGRHRSPLVLRVVEDYLDGRRLPLSATCRLD